MDSSRMERWLKVILYEILRDRRSLNRTGARPTSSTRKSTTADVGRRAEKFPSHVCSRPVQRGEEKPSPETGQSPHPEPYEVEENYITEAMMHAAKMRK